ncbi:hypothetical protein K8R62_04270 [bacterium]|nr:hypothetical protein [bacterium]
MIKYFKLSNIVLIFLFCAIVYFGYFSFFKKDSEINIGNIFTNKQTDNDIGQVNDKPESKNNNLDKEIENKTASSNSVDEKEVITPIPKIKQMEIPERILEEDRKEEPSNGFYENPTYSYQAKFPKDWPLRIRSKENVSFGYVIPKDGLGAVTIEVSQDAGNEIEEAKKEAKKYPGMIEFKEETIFIDGFQGTKYTLIENMSGEKDFYILIEKNKYSYLIKYPGESDDLDSKRFLGEVNYILDNFKFND